MRRKPEESGRPPPKKRGELLRIDLPFDDALKVALETEPPAKEKTKRNRRPKPP
jgi:hypothetical protein